jgi:hypothetical protein
VGEECNMNGTQDLLMLHDDLVTSVVGVVEEGEQEVLVSGSTCNRTQLLIFLPLVQTVFSLIYVFIGVCGFLGNSLIVLAAVRYVWT